MLRILSVLFFCCVGTAWAGEWPSVGGYVSTLRGWPSYSAGGAVAVAPWRAISATSISSVARTTQVSAGTQLNRRLRSQLVIGADCTELKLLFTNWYAGASAVTDNSNAVDIVKVSLEKVSGGSAYTTVNFSGARTATLSAGQESLLSDSILPAAFGLSKFTRGESYFVRVHDRVASAGHAWVSSRDGSTITGATDYALVYDIATATVGDVDGTGNIASSGTGRTAANIAGPIVLCRPVDASVSVFVAVGDSITEHTSGSQGQIQGWFGASLWDAGYTNGPAAGTNPRPGLNLGRGQSVAALWSTGSYTKLRALLQYGNVLIDNYGINGTGTAPSYPEVQAIWNEARGRAYKKIIRHKLLPRTTSTDSWATAGNQTKVAGYLGGGEFLLFNDFLASQLGVKIDLLILNADVRDTDGDKWLSNGTAAYATGDGLHPNNTTHGLIGANARAAYNSLGL